MGEREGGEGRWERENQGRKNADGGETAGLVSEQSLKAVKTSLCFL